MIVCQKFIKTLAMLKIGSIIRIFYPDYASGQYGVILARENAQRWLVGLWDYSKEIQLDVILSLSESEFELL